MLVYVKICVNVRVFVFTGEFVEVTVLVAEAEGCAVSVIVAV